MKQHKEVEKKRPKSSSTEHVNSPELKGGSIGADPVVPITDKTNPKGTRLIMQVLEKENLNVAYYNVVGNKGSAGVDGMTVKELKPYLKERWTRLQSELERGTY